jgi:hypothetical protein
MTTKAGSNGQRAEQVLAAVRQLRRDGFLRRTALRELGIESAADALSFGDHRLVRLVVEAGRARGFGGDPIDVKLVEYLDGTFGAGRWQRDRDPWPWEQGAGDEQLDRLFEDQTVAIADCAKAEAAMWAAREELAERRQKEGVTFDVVNALTKTLEIAIATWQEAGKRASIARGRVTTRQLFLQDRYRRQQEAKK